MPNSFFVRIPFEGVYGVKSIDFATQEIVLKRPGLPEKTMSMQSVREMGVVADFNIYQLRGEE